MPRFFSGPLNHLRAEYVLRVLGGHVHLDLVFVVLDPINIFVDVLLLSKTISDLENLHDLVSFLQKTKTYLNVSSACTFHILDNFVVASSNNFFMQCRVHDMECEKPGQDNENIRIKKCNILCPGRHRFDSTAGLHMVPFNTRRIGKR